MPLDRSKYPKEWEDFSKSIRSERAGHRCECYGECGLHHQRRCIETNGDDARYAKGRIVLTVAHLCECSPPCINEKHVKAMCQRCHLRVDSKMHMKNAKETRRKKKAIGELF